MSPSALRRQIGQLLIAGFNGHQLPVELKGLAGTNKVNGNSSSTLQGALYFPSQSLLYNGTSGMQTQCLQMVASTVTFSGNSTITNTCPSNSGAHSFTGAVVQLVE